MGEVMEAKIGVGVMVTVRPGSRRGISLIEVLAASVVLLVGIWAVVSIFPAGERAIKSATTQDLAMGLAQKEITMFTADPGRLPESMFPGSFSSPAYLNNPYLKRADHLVKMKESPWSVQGERLVFRNISGLSQVFGALLGFPPAIESTIRVYREVEYLSASHPDSFSDGRTYEQQQAPNDKEITINLRSGTLLSLGRVRVDYMITDGSPQFIQNEPYTAMDTTEQLKKKIVLVRGGGQAHRTVEVVRVVVEEQLNGWTPVYDYAGGSIVLMNTSGTGASLDGSVRCDYEIDTVEGGPWLIDDVAVEGMVTIRHYPPSDPNNYQTLTIPLSEWSGHQLHGDDLVKELSQAKVQFPPIQPSTRLANGSDHVGAVGMPPPNHTDLVMLKPLQHEDQLLKGQVRFEDRDLATQALLAPHGTRVRIAYRSFDDGVETIWRQLFLTPSVFTLRPLAIPNVGNTAVSEPWREYWLLSSLQTTPLRKIVVRALHVGLLVSVDYVTTDGVRISSEMRSVELAYENNTPVGLVTLSHSARSILSVRGASFKVRISGKRFGVTNRAMGGGSVADLEAKEFGPRHFFDLDGTRLERVREP